MICCSKFLVEIYAEICWEMLALAQNLDLGLCFTESSEWKHDVPSLIIGHSPACHLTYTLSHFKWDSLCERVEYARLLPIVMALPNGFPPNPRSVVIFLLPRDGWLPIYHPWHLVFLGYFFIDFSSDMSIFLAYFFMDNSVELLRDPLRWPHCICIMYCMYCNVSSKKMTLGKER